VPQAQLKRGSSFFVENGGMQVIQTSDGGYAVVGHSISFRYSGSHEIFLMKLDEHGVVVGE
jgi:hypothetical protein